MRLHSYEMHIVCNAHDIPKNHTKEYLMNQPNKPSTNLAAQKRELSEAPEVTQPHSSEDALELHDMSRKARRHYKWTQEKEKLKELSFWRKVQYILMYYTWKFLAVVAVFAVIAIIIHRIYIATRPVALDIALVNDPANYTFEDTVTTLYQSYYEVPDDALFLVDTNYEIHPDETYTSQDMAYYSKMMSALTHESTHIIICDEAVVKYYAVDGYMMELKHALPDDLFSQLQEQGRLYECDGPVTDADYYAIDLSGMAFVEEAGIHLEHPYLCIPSVLTDENREIAYNFIRIVLDLGEQ